MTTEQILATAMPDCIIVFCLINTSFKNNATFTETDERVYTIGGREISGGVIAALATAKNHSAAPHEALTKAAAQRVPVGK